MDKYYVYALLIGSDEESMTPFYIGKGCGKRLEHHFKPWSLKQKSYKNNKIKAALVSGLKLEAIKLWENLSEENALILERQEIEYFNTTSIKLCNIYDGGLAKNYDKSVRKVELKELDALIKSFLLRPEVTLLQDWINHVSHVYSVGCAKNIYRGEIYADLRAEYKNFGGKMTEIQAQEYRRRLSLRTSGCNNPTYKPHLNTSQILLLRVIHKTETIQVINDWVSSCGFAKLSRKEQSLLRVIKPPKERVIKPPKERVIKPPKERVIKPPKERRKRRVKNPSIKALSQHTALEREYIMQLYLKELQAEVTNPRLFIAKYKLLIKEGTLKVWFKRMNIKTPKAFQDSSAGGKATALKSQKPIIQIKDGVIINRFDSCTHAHRALGYSQGNIRNVCEGVYNQAYGYHWEYVIQITSKPSGQGYNRGVLNKTYHSTKNAVIKLNVTKE